MKTSLPFIFLVILNMAHPLIAGKHARELAQSPNAKKIIEFSCGIQEFTPIMPSSNALYRYEDPKTQELVPILQYGEKYEFVIKNPQAINEHGFTRTAYQQMRDKQIREGRKRIMYLMGAGTFVTTIAGLGFSPILGGLSQMTVLWGVSLPSALAINPQVFKPWEKYKQAQLIDIFLQDNVQRDCQSITDFKERFVSALGLKHT